MNRPLIITTGIVIIGLVVFVWVYLLLYGTPKEPREVFTNFGFLTPIEDGLPVITEGAAEEAVTNLSLIGGLEQLGTRSVAGHGFMLTDEAILLRYAEMGTGHIYQMNLTQAEETQVSITTFPETAQAIFSDDGQWVILSAYAEGGETSTIGRIDTELKELTNTASLPQGAQNVAFRDASSIYYTQETSTHTNGFYYDISRNTSVEVFSVPLREIIVQWGKEEHILITRPTMHLTGAMYSMRNGILSPLGNSGIGLLGLANDTISVTTYVQPEGYASYAFHNDEQLKQSGILIPEKCAFDQIAPTEIWCGIPTSEVDAGFVDQWYKGDRSTSDSLWFIDLLEGSSRRMVPMEEVANREVDILDMRADITGTYLAFTNKLDSSLWLYTIE